MVFDYARIRIVVEDRRSAIGALVAGARFVRRHPEPSRRCTLDERASIPARVVFTPCRAWRAWPGLASDRVLALGQIYILLRHYVKLLFYASQMALFQNALAHAAYTAAPAVVWPDSPAAESIANANGAALP